MKSEHKLKLASERLASFAGMAARSVHASYCRLKIGPCCTLPLFTLRGVVDVGATEGVACEAGVLVLCRSTSISAMQIANVRRKVVRKIDPRGTGLKSNLSSLRFATCVPGPIKCHWRGSVAVRT